MRTIPMPPSPRGVAIAAIVSLITAITSTYILSQNKKGRARRHTQKLHSAPISALLPHGGGDLLLHSPFPHRRNPSPLGGRSSARQHSWARGVSCARSD